MLATELADLALLPPLPQHPLPQRITAARAGLEAAQDFEPARVRQPTQVQVGEGDTAASSASSAPTTRSMLANMFESYRLPLTSFARPTGRGHTAAQTTPDPDAGFGPGDHGLRKRRAGNRCRDSCRTPTTVARSANACPLGSEMAGAPTPRNPGGGCGARRRARIAHAARGGMCAARTEGARRADTGERRTGSQIVSRLRDSTWFGGRRTPSTLR